MQAAKLLPAAKAALYATEQMPEDLRHAHQPNDGVLERNYIGSHFKE